MKIIIEHNHKMNEKKEMTKKKKEKLLIIMIYLFIYVYNNIIREFPSYAIGIL